MAPLPGYGSTLGLRGLGALVLSATSFADQAPSSADPSDGAHQRGRRPHRQSWHKPDHRSRRRKAAARAKQRRLHCGA